MPDPENYESIDDQLRNLRSNISDLGYEIDSFKAQTAGALGLGVFLLLLAALVAYDLFSGKQVVWQMLGVSRAALRWIAGVIGGIGVILLSYGLLRIKRSDNEASARLEQMEQQYAELVERQTYSQETSDRRDATS
jgi:hypothetical protein